MSYPKLRGAIREKFSTQLAFSKAMSMNPSTLSNKLAGKSQWTGEEIKLACDLLDIPLEKAHAYFFNR